MVNFFGVFLPTLWGFLLAFVLGGCALRPHDPHSGKSTKDYKNFFDHRKKEDFFNDSNQSNILKIDDTLCIPDVFMRKIVLHIRPEAYLADTLQHLAQLHNFNVVIQPSLLTKCGVFYRATHKKMIDIILDVCRMHRIKFFIQDRTLYLEEDVPYLHYHSVQFLLGTRETASSLQVSAGVYDDDSSLQQNRSYLSINSKSKGDFWKDLEAVLKTILRLPHQKKPSQRPLLLRKKGRAKSAFSKKIHDQESISCQENKEESVENTSNHKDISLEDAQNPKNSNNIIEPEESVQNATHSNEKIPHYAIQQHSGMIAVYGHQHHHQKIAEYLQRLRRLLLAQILIEAKFIEVTLSNQYESGIDWEWLNSATSTRLPSQINTNTGLTALNIYQKNSHTTLRLLEKFGTTRTLSSPRMLVSNNQMAAFKVMRNEVYFIVRNEQTTNIQANNYVGQTSSAMRVVPVGLVLTVQPSIDFQTGTVLLCLRPSVSRVVDVQQDPLLAKITGQSANSGVPIIRVKELDTVIATTPGQVLVLGGLREEIGEHSLSGLPDTQQIDYFNRLLNNQKQQRSSTELVILLKVNVTPLPKESDHQAYQFVLGNAN